MRWLEPDELTAWRHLSAVLLLLPGKLDEALAEYDMTFFDYSILAALSGAEDRTLRVSDLAFLTQGSLSRLSHATKRLEKRGWVSRHPCPGDGRVTMATLTDEGYARLVEAAPAHVTSVRQAVFDGLGAGQVEQLRTLCAGVLEAIAPGQTPMWERG